MNQNLKIKKKDPSFGFTLTELLMVVVILGILSAVALPRFSPQKEKAYVSEAVGMLSAIRQVEEVYRLENILISSSSFSWIKHDGKVRQVIWRILGKKHFFSSGKQHIYYPFRLKKEHHRARALPMESAFESLFLIKPDTPVTSFVRYYHPIDLAILSRLNI